MRLDNKQIIELIGVTSVVASLIFVGLQLMLDRRVAVADQYAARAESIKNDRRAQLESESFMSLQTKNWADGIRPEWWNEELEHSYSDRNLTGAEIYSEIISIRMYVTHADNLHFQYTQGLLDEFFYDEFINSLKADLRDPLQRAIFMSNPRRLGPIIEDILNEIERESGT